MKSSWKRKILGEVIELRYGKGISRFDRSPSGKYPVYGANGVLGYSDKYLIDNEAVIVGRKGSAGEVIRVSGKFWPSDVTYYVLGNERIDIDYAFHLLKSLNLQRLAVGVKPGVNRNRVYEIEIPLPSLAEQKKIVARIERVLAKIKEAKRLRAEVRVATRALLSAELHKIFEEGARKGWEEKTIEQITHSVQYGYTASACENGNSRLLRITDIQKGKVNWGTVPYCECEDLEKYKLYDGDIVFARTGATVGKSYLISNPPENAIFASYLIRVRIDRQQCSPELLYYFFQSSDYWDQITEHAVGGAQPNVNGSKLKQIGIALPPLAEQKKIVARLDALSAQLKKLEEHQKTADLDLVRLEQSVLHQAFTGESV